MSAVVSLVLLSPQNEQDFCCGFNATQSRQPRFMVQLRGENGGSPPRQAIRNVHVSYSAMAQNNSGDIMVKMTPLAPATVAITTLIISHTNYNDEAYIGINDVHLT
jgi:hypothetical protein